MPTDEFIQKISNSMGQITQLLVTLERILINLPTKGDSEDLDKTIEELKNTIYVLHTEFSTYLADNAELHEKLKNIVNHLDNSATLKDPNLILNHIKLEKELYTKLIDDDQSDLIAAGTLAKALLKEHETLKIKLDTDDVVKAQDLADFLEYVKYKSKSYRFWSGWKAKVAIIMGTITGILVGGSKIVEIILKISEQIQTTPPPGM